MYKIAVLGSPDTVTGFKALGLDAFPVREPEEAARLLKRLAKPEREDAYPIIYIEEDLAREIMPVIERYRGRPSPAVILIPGRGGSLGLGSAALQAAVEKAVGSNIL